MQTLSSFVVHVWDSVINDILDVMNCELIEFYSKKVVCLDSGEESQLTMNERLLDILSCISPYSLTILSPATRIELISSIIQEMIDSFPSSYKDQYFKKPSSTSNVLEISTAADVTVFHDDSEQLRDAVPNSVVLNTDSMDSLPETRRESAQHPLPSGAHQTQTFKDEFESPTATQEHSQDYEDQQLLFEMALSLITQMLKLLSTVFVRF